MTLYTHATENRVKTWFYLFLYMTLLLGLGWLVSWYFGSPDILLIAAVIVLIQGIISYQFSDKIALLVSRARPLNHSEYAEVYEVMDNLAITAGLPRPKLYLIEDSALNAFATGKDPTHASIVVTSGLLEQLNKNELAGVLAHELSHVGNEDIRLMSMVMIMAGLIALISDLFLRNVFWGRNRDDSSGSRSSAVLAVVAIVLALLAPLAATLMQLAISRKREFLADATGVLLTRYPEGLISALRKLEADKEPLEAANKATAHMYIKNPLPGGFLATLFSTHPSIEDRISALQKGSGMS